MGFGSLGTGQEMLEPKVGAEMGARGRAGTAEPAGSGMRRHRGGERKESNVLRGSPASSSSGGQKQPPLPCWPRPRPRPRSSSAHHGMGAAAAAVAGGGPLPGRRVAALLHLSAPWVREVLSHTSIPHLPPEAHLALRWLL